MKKRILIFCFCLLLYACIFQRGYGQILASNLPLRNGDNQAILTRSLSLKESLPKNQAIPITGTVRDEKGETLPGASVLIKGTQKGVSTDLTGSFQIDVPSESSILVINVYEEW